MAQPRPSAGRAGLLLHPQSQNSHDLLLALVRFILNFLPGCTCPASAGLSVSGSGTIRRAPNFLAAEERESFRDKYLCPKAPLRRGLSFVEGEPNPRPRIVSPEERQEGNDGPSSPAHRRAGLFFIGRRPRRGGGLRRRGPESIIL